MRAQVINNSQGPIYAQMPARGKDTAGHIEPGSCINIIPGLNLIDTEVLATLRKNSTFENFFKTAIAPSKAPEANPASFGKPILQIGGKEVPDENPLSKLAEQACKAMIGEMQSTDVLQDWLKGEGRADVRRDIENRLIALSDQIQKKSSAS